MHILFLSDNFPPEVNAPASRTFEHTREWVGAGHQVTVVTCVPNFPKGKVYAGYRNKLWQEEEMDGIRVIRVWSYISANEGFAKRMLDYLSYMVSATLASLFVRKVDVVIGTSPQFFTACAAWKVSFFKRVPFIFELRDLWPESIKAVGAMGDSFAIRCLERLELFLYRRARLVVSVTRSFKENLISRGIDAAKIEVITNGVDLSRFQPMEKDPELLRQYGLEGKFIVGYIGTHGMAHALETLLESAMELKNHPDGKKVHCILLGDGARKKALQQQAKEMGLDNVLFVDSVPKEEVPRYWSLLDVSIVHLKKDPLFTTVIPSKIFECMGMGLPLLYGVQGESADMVKENDVGLLFTPEDSHALTKEILKLKANPDMRSTFHQNGLQAARQYDRKTLAHQMLELIQSRLKL